MLTAKYRDCNGCGKSRPPASFVPRSSRCEPCRIIKQAMDRQYHIPITPESKGRWAKVDYSQHNIPEELDA